MQTVLIAGGAGFIGSHLCEKLLYENYSVICLDNFLTSDKQNIIRLLSNPNFRFIQEDVSFLTSATKEFLKQANFIFHLASPASPNKNSKRSYINYPIETMLVNSLGTYNLLEIAKISKASFLYASTSEIYGDPQVSPQPESYFGNVNPNGIRSVYDEGKRFGEAMTMAYVRKHNVDSRIVRIFNTYGPNMQQDDGRVVSNFIMQALYDQPLTIYGDGTQTRSFCYVADMIAGLCAAMFTAGLRGEVVNLGNPNERRIIDFAKIIKEAIQGSSQIIFQPLPQDDPKQRKPDITKAKRLLGWEPTVSLESGLEKTIAYFRSLKNAQTK